MGEAVTGERRTIELSTAMATPRARATVTATTRLGKAKAITASSSPTVMASTTMDNDNKRGKATKVVGQKTGGDPKWNRRKNENETAKEDGFASTTRSKQGSQVHVDWTCPECKTPHSCGLGKWQVKRTCRVASCRYPYTGHLDADPEEKEKKIKEWEEKRGERNKDREKMKASGLTFSDYKTAKAKYPWTMLDSDNEEEVKETTAMPMEEDAGEAQAVDVAKGKTGEHVSRPIEVSKKDWAYLSYLEGVQKEERSKGKSHPEICTQIQDLKAKLEKDQKVKNPKKEEDKNTIKELKARIQFVQEHIEMVENTGIRQKASKQSWKN